MSTKIYTAYKFDAKLHNLIAPMLGYRDRILIQARHGLRSMLGAQPSISDTAAVVKDAILKGVHNPFNFNSSLVLLCHPRVTGTIMVPFGVDYIEKLGKKKVPLPRGAKDWGYWNNSDRPKKVSDAEWKQRERDYSLLVKQGGSSFADMGFIMRIIEHDNAWNFVWDTLTENESPKTIKP